MDNNQQNGKLNPDIQYSPGAVPYHRHNGTDSPLLDSSKVATSVTASGAGITVSPTTGAVIVQNTGVTSAIAGQGISVSGATGAVTITNTGPSVFKNGALNYPNGAGTQTIAHGLGVVPKMVRIHAIGLNRVNAAFPPPFSHGSYNGTSMAVVYSRETGTVAGGASVNAIGNSTSYIVYIQVDGNAHPDGQYATITADATNITLTWTQIDALGNSTTVYLEWEAEG